MWVEVQMSSAQRLAALATEWGNNPLVTRMVRVAPANTRLAWVAMRVCIATDVTMSLPLSYEWLTLQVGKYGSVRRCLKPKRIVTFHCGREWDSISGMAGHTKGCPTCREHYRAKKEVPPWHAEDSDSHPLPVIPLPTETSAQPAEPEEPYDTPSYVILPAGSFSVVWKSGRVWPTTTRAPRLSVWQRVKLALGLML